MPKRVCQHCGHQFTIPDWLVGEEFACPDCGKSILQPRQVREPNEKIKLVVTPPPVEVYPAAQLSEIAQAIIANVQRVIVGKPEQVSLAVAGLFAEGHILFEDVPGVAKTMLSRAVAQSVGCSFKRIQCTPDLQPENVIGDFILDPTTGRKDFRFGPLFSQMVLVDEINRASPRTQAALLEAMGEGMVTMDRTSYRLERPFMVMATQNPIEQEGTFRLPEAQMDRFLIRLSLGYPSAAEEKEMCVRAQQQHPIESLKPVTTADEILKCQRGVRDISVGADVCDYLVELTRATRGHPALRLGASPRGSLGLFHTAQALAAIHGSASVSIDHVKIIAVSVLAHRLLLRTEALKDYPDAAAVVREILTTVQVQKL
jgi:MoxR-like ATPase